MKLNTLLLLTLCGILHAKIMVVDDVSDLRQLFNGGTATPMPKRKLKFPWIGRGVPAIGYQPKRMLWSVICDSEKHGKVPGKMLADGRGWYTVGKDYFKCTNVVDVLKGDLFRPDGSLPSECKWYRKGGLGTPRSYPAVILSKHGFIPGKATLSPQEAWYTRFGKVFSVKDKFYILC